MAHRTALTALTAAIGLSAAVVLASCASTPQADDTAPPAESAPAPTTSDEGSTATPDATQTTTDIDLEGALAAIELAETETGGFAYELDDEDDDGSWEVHVANGTEEWEVHVTAEGTSVLSNERDGDVDDDDRAALDTAGVTLIEAIESGAREYTGSGALDDATLDDDDSGTFAWEISFDDDVDVYIAVTDGALLRVD